MVFYLLRAANSRPLQRVYFLVLSIRFQEGQGSKSGEHQIRHWFFKELR